MKRAVSLLLIFLFSTPLLISVPQIIGSLEEPTGELTLDEVHTLDSNSLSIDSDNDTLLDDFEVLQFGSDPTLPDTDFDDMTDYEEYLAGTDPLVADANDDADGDGVSNIDEWEAGTDIFDSDSDHDGISDLHDQNPLRYDVPFPITEFMMIGVLMIGSIVPALAVVLLNERMFRRTRGSPRRGAEEEYDDAREES